MGGAENNQVADLGILGDIVGVLHREINLKINCRKGGIYGQKTYRR